MFIYFVIYVLFATLALLLTYLDFLQRENKLVSGRVPAQWLLTLSDFIFRLSPVVMVRHPKNATYRFCNSPKFIKKEEADKEFRKVVGKVGRYGLCIALVGAALVGL